MVSLSLSYTKTYADTPTWDCPSLQAKTLYKHIPYCTHAGEDFHFKSVNTKFSDPKSTIFITQEKNNNSLFCFSIPFLVTTQKKKDSDQVSDTLIFFLFISLTPHSLSHCFTFGNSWAVSDLCFALLLSLVNKKKGIFEKMKNKILGFIENSDSLACRPFLLFS